MQVSKKKVNSQLDKQISSMWYQLIADIETPQEAELIVSSVLSETELIAVTKRLAVGYWLLKKRSYENIKQNLKVSSATIAAVGADLEKAGWKAAMKKVTAEEWATKMEERIKSIFNRS